MSKIIIGSIALSFHQASAGVFHCVLHHLGYDVEVITAPHEQMFDWQAQGKVDILMSAWLPGSHGKYLSSYENRVTKLSPIYTPYCIWAVPEYISESVIGSVGDLNHPEIVSKMNKTIHGIGMGAGISRFSVEMLHDYGLEANGYHFVSNEPDVFYELVEEKIKKKEWLIIPLWHPQYLHHLFKLRAIAEPKGLLRGKDEATPLVLNGSRAKFAPEHLHILSKITFGNEAIAEIEYMFNKQQKSAFESARLWIIKNFGTIEKFYFSF